MKRLKKGFTIVELVIVIAVIAILAAVLIPVFSNIVDKANQSKDTQLVRNLNTALKSDLDEHDTMYDALQAAKDYGYDVGKINASATDNEILWDSKNDCFVYLNGGKIEYIPNSKTVENVADHEYWIISDTVSTKYSTYYIGDEAEVTVETGFDAGDIMGITVNVVTDKARTLTIRTSSILDIVTIDAPNATIHAYGFAGEYDVIAVDSNSLYIYGQVDFVKVNAGHVVVESGAEVKGVHVVSANADVEVQATAIIPTVTVEDIAFASTVNGVAQSEIAQLDAETAKAGAKLFAGGNGTQSLPYIIETAKQLNNINEVYGQGFKYFKMADDVEAINGQDLSVIYLQGSFDGNGVKFVNLTQALFNKVGFENEVADIVIKNVDATMNSKNGQALVRNLFNAGTTIFENVKVHGYIEGTYNIGSFYNYGTANFDGVGASYTVKFINSTSDATLVCKTGNRIGGMIGHAYEGAGNTFSLYVDANSCYTGKMFSTTTDGTKYIAINSNYSVFKFNGENRQRDEAAFKYADIQKIVQVNAIKEDGYSVVAQANVARFEISLNAQMSVYTPEGDIITNQSGLTWVIDTEEALEVVAGETIKVFDAFESAAIINNPDDVLGYDIEDGVLNIYTGSSNNFKDGTITLYVTQYDTMSNIVAITAINLATVTYTK